MIDATHLKAHRTAASLQGAVKGVSRLHSGPLTPYGWVYNTAAITSIPVEIYVGGAHGTGTLAATVTADQPRPDINTAHSPRQRSRHPAYAKT